MNVENILKVADAIESHSVPNMVFHMNYEFTKYPTCESADMKARGISTHDCGAAACIIGWTNTVIHGAGTMNSFGRAMEALGIESGVGEDLFYPDTSVNYDDITPKQAADVLRHLAATGKVDWTV